MRRDIASALFALVLSASVCAGDRPASRCHGTPAQGSLEHGWQLPSAGPNFEAYSALGVLAGRNFVHSKVHALVTGAYAVLERQAPGKHYVYGETGSETGGRFPPHKTHQNGLSVDFFVPVMDGQGQSVALPISVFNKLGYAIAFDDEARYQGLTIDFEALAQHLLAIRQAADQEGVGIGVVIFDNALQQRLFATPAGRQLPQLIRFSTKKPWIRHDNHYHIDFIVPCV